MVYNVVKGNERTMIAEEVNRYCNGLARKAYLAKKMIGK